MTHIERDVRILECLHQVGAMARRLHRTLPRYVDLDDLISAGTIGLIAAIESYDPGRGIMLKTYAEWKIRGAMLDSLRELDPASRDARQRFNRIRDAITALEQRLGRAPTEGEIAAELGLSLDQYHAELMEMPGTEMWRLDQPLQMTGKTLAETVATSEDRWPSEIAQRAELSRLLRDAIEKLPPPERFVIRAYLDRELTQGETAKLMGLHASRVSQLTKQAVGLLRDLLAKAAGNFKAAG